jgi:hypothetical protein
LNLLLHHHQTPRACRSPGFIHTHMLLLLLLHPTCWVIWFHPQRVTPGTMAEV